jgi:hypothetical protein
MTPKCCINTNVAAERIAILFPGSKLGTETGSPDIIHYYPQSLELVKKMVIHISTTDCGTTDISCIWI